MMQCYYMDISCDCSYEQSQLLCRNLPEERIEKIKRLKNPVKAKKSMLSGYLLQYGLQKELGMPAKEISFQYGEYGKPLLSERTKQLYREKAQMDNGTVPAYDMDSFDFNLSHSGDYAVLAISNSAVGIDIECRRAKERLAVAERFFSKLEYEDILGTESDKERQRRFMEYWTMKEAYVKLKGMGMKIPFSSFLIVRDNEEMSHIDGEPLYYVSKFLDEDKYCVSVCSGDKNALETLQKYSSLFVEIRLKSVLKSTFFL